MPKQAGKSRARFRTRERVPRHGNMKGQETAHFYKAKCQQDDIHVRSVNICQASPCVREI